MTSPLETSNPLNPTATRRKWLAALGASLGVALLIVCPFFRLGTASGHDIAFHASSWLDVAGQWKEGIVYPRWCEWANNGFGEPRFIFYPPLSWMLGAALGFVAPWNAVPGVFIVLAQTLAGMSMFALARRFFSAPAATFAAACYAANPYALLVVYMRSDFAEELACALLPLLLLAVLQLSGLIENRWQSVSRMTAIFAVLFALVWLSNAPAGVLAGYSIALLFAWAAIAEKSLRPLWRGAGGLALGFGLAGFYLLPAAYEQRWVNIGQALSSGLQPTQNFLYTDIADPEHNLFNWIASSVAVLLMAMTAIAALLAKRNEKNEEDREGARRLWLAMLLLSVAATVFMIRPSAILWELLPKLRFVQFPWRWMGVMAVPYAFFGGAAVARRRTGWIWLSVVVLASAATATFLVRKAWWDSDDIPVLQDAIASGKGFDGTDEYDPLGDDHTNLPQKTPLVQILPSEEPRERRPQAEIHVERWTGEEKVVRVNSIVPARLSLRLLDYPAWQVKTNGRAMTPQRVEDTGQIILPLPAGEQTIALRFARTRDVIVGDTLSLTSLLFLVVISRVRAAKSLQLRSQTGIANPTDK